MTGTSAAAEIQSNRLLYSTATPEGVFAYAQWFPETPDYEVEIDVYTPDSTADPEANDVGVVARGNIEQPEGYAFRFFPRTEAVAIQKYIDGELTGALDSAEFLRPAADTTFNMRFKVEGSTLRGYVDGVLLVEAIDSELTTPGQAGIRMAGVDPSSESTGWHISSFRAADFGISPSPSLSPSASPSPSSSGSPSASLSPSASGSVSVSPSLSPSSSPSASTSPSPPPPQPDLVYLDPGGDAVHAAGYFHTNVVGSGTDITYDATVQVAGAGSYRFDSNTNEDPKAEIPDVLGASGRVSFYWRYDSVPDKIETVSEFCEDEAVYSGGGFVTPQNTAQDDGQYATATPAKNSGQGDRMIILGGVDVPVGAVIDSVKIIYERKYDVDTSIGISRVKWIVNGEEGPDHDNTDMPLTDTIVEVDVTGDRAWEWQDFFADATKIVGEARRGDTDTAHTQSWDFVKVEVEYHLATAILGPPKSGGGGGWGFQITVTPKGSDVVVRFIDGAGVGYDGITNLAINTPNRLSFGYVYHGVDDLDINVFVNGIPELSIEEASTGGVTLSSDLRYGWLRTPGVDHVCWFSHLAIDDGDDLSDIGNILSTAKRSAGVNENNWNTTGGTGAVNERPLSETNFIAEVDGIARLRQSYTLEAADEGDVDLTGESLIGYMGWAWAKISALATEPVDLIVNNVLVDQTLQISSVPGLLRHAVTDSSYPSHAAGIGMRNAPELLTTTMYECGVIQAYEGPPNPDILLERQLVNNETLATIADDLRADPPASYEVCCNFPEFDGSVEIVVHSLDQDGGSVSYQGTLNSNGRMRISPGVEVYLDVTVVGVTNLQIWRRLNVD